MGENGTGKSTLLEAIAVVLGFNAEGGSRNFNFYTYNSHSSLGDYLVLSKGVRRPKKTAISCGHKVAIMWQAILQCWTEHTRWYIAYQRQLWRKNRKSSAYEKTEHFQITKNFINNYKGVIRALLND